MSPERSALVLASTSPTRALMLTAAGVAFSVQDPRVDEPAIRAALVADGATPRDIADALAEAKARRVAQRVAERLVLGGDQVLDLDGAVLSKATDPQDAAETLRRLSGRTHRLLSAAVLYEDGRPVWRHVGVARMTVRVLSAPFIDDFVARHWDGIRGSVGCYRIEAEGVLLMERIEGDHFTILGLPLVELLNYLVVRGVVRT